MTGHSSNCDKVRTLKQRQGLCQWLEESGCTTLFINPRSPWENGYIESSIDKLRDECLNREVSHN